MKKETLDLFVSEVVAGWEKKFIPGDSLVPYSGVVYDNDEVKALLETVVSGWMISSDINRKFEDEISKVFGKKYCLTVNSGTSANMLATYFIKERLEKEKRPLNVLTTPSCFPSTITPFLQYGFNVSFVDCVLEGSYNIDVSKLEKTIKEKNIQVLCFATVLGNPVDMEKVKYICDKYNVLWLNDNCDSFGSKYRGNEVGSYGYISTLSMFPAHFISTWGEGGLVGTDDEKTYREMYKLRAWSRTCTCVSKEDSKSKYGKCGSRYSDWLNIGTPIDHRYCFDGSYGGGFNLKMLELQAAVGLEQLKKIPSFLSIRKYNFDRLDKCFEKYPEHFERPVAQKESEVNWFAYPVRVISKKFNRQEFIDYLEDKKIQTRLLFSGNILRHKGFAERCKANPDDYPNSDIVLKEVMMLGVSQVITPEMMDYVCSTIDEFMEGLK